MVDFVTVSSMCRIEEDMQLSAVVKMGRMMPAAGEGALMGVIIIIEGNMKLP
ncbi:MAG TPA: hypothetical protein VMW16_15350 [Sedimentisphaerales bacterium]|nr:hypothetical protein [Sedimentisphaerales bacterium]